MKSGFPRPAQIALNLNDCVWRKFSIAVLVARNSIVLPLLLGGVHDFETISAPQPETPRSPCGQNAPQKWADFPPGQSVPRSSPHTLAFA
jgi:hypothetical protein